MPADEHLGNYQFGKYLFTRRAESGSDWYDEVDEPTADSTQYKMYRAPNTVESEALGEDWAPAYDAGTMDVLHHPPAEELPKRRVVGNAAAMEERRLNPSAIGAEGTGRVVHSRSFHEKYSPRDVVDFLTVDKGSRLMVSTMLGLGQQAARERTGQDLQASTSLSPHSQKLVAHLKAGGLVPQSHEHSANRLNFLPAWPVNVPGGLEGHFSNLMSQRGWDSEPEEPIPATEVAEARETGRDIVRRSRPRRRGS